MLDYRIYFLGANGRISRAVAFVCEDDAAAIELAGTDRIVIASFGTDGVDGPTDAAGAFATGRTCGDATSRGLDAREHLERNDSHPFFNAVGSLIRTGTTGTNVNDIEMALIYGP